MFHFKQKETHGLTGIVETMSFVLNYVAKIVLFMHSVICNALFAQLLIIVIIMNAIPNNPKKIFTTLPIIEFLYCKGSDLVKYTS